MPGNVKGRRHVADIDQRFRRISEPVTKFAFKAITVPFAGPAPGAEFCRYPFQAYNMAIQSPRQATQRLILEALDLVVTSHQGGDGEIPNEGAPVDLPELPLRLEAVAHTRDLSEVRQEVAAEHDPVRAHIVDQV